MQIVLQIDLGTDKDEAQYASRRVAEILSDAVREGGHSMIDPTAIERVASQFSEFCNALANNNNKEAA